MKKKINFHSKFLVFLTIFLLIFTIFSLNVSAADYQDYAPILYFEEKETCYPVSVEYLFDNYQEKTIDLTINNQSVQIPYYDNVLGTTDNNNIISDYATKYENNDPKVYPTVYYRIEQGSDATYIQYWMFYIFNDGEHNRHEGDWEMVQVVIPSNGNKWVAFSQHYSGQRVSWDLVEKDNNNIKVYVARGSHANFIKPYSGKLGISSDIVSDNGKVLWPSGYNLVELSNQVWLDFEGLWGEIKSEEDFITGQAGPQGPKYRTDMMGTQMWDGISWGSGLLETNNLFFMAEWFLYNFITILISITVLFLALTIFLIYRKHKKYGLGPRIISIFYIDGLNLYTIGNILFFTALIIAIIGLFNNWYLVSANINLDIMQTGGFMDVIKIDGINGMQMYMPSQYGSIPMGNAALPFAYIFLIGFIFMFLSTIGIYKSNKLGRKYILKGIRFIMIFVFLIIFLLVIGFFIDSMPSGGTGSGLPNLLNSISSNPVGGSYSIPSYDLYPGTSGTIEFQWGVGLGMILLVLSGIIFIVGGVFEIVSTKEFFKLKTPIDKKQDISDKTKKEKKEENKQLKTNFCPKCGAKLENQTRFCHECGTRI